METINEEFSFDLPDGFRRLSDEELSKRYSSEVTSRVGYLGRDGETLLVFSWYKMNWFLLRLADLKSAIKRNESLTESAYKGRDFTFYEYLHESYAGVDMEGYAFAFNGESGKKNGTAFLFKGKRHLYAANLYMLADGETSAEEIKPILSSFKKK